MLRKIIFRSDILKILTLFLIWRVLLIAVFVISSVLIPLRYTDKYLGGGPFFFNLSPELFSWANFDGEHYLSIAIFGYKALEQAFFPIYPVLISFFAQPFSTDLSSKYVYSTLMGLLISNISLFLSLFLLFKLIVLDFSRKVAFFTIIILLVFPTSFYFGSLYNESLFLAFTLGSFYSVRKKRYFLGSFLGIIASATRVFGILLLPALLIEVFQGKEGFSKWFWILFIPLGLICYMLYQYLTFGDPLAFYNLQTVVGEQHQKGIVLLPQVYFRYIKMLLSVDISNPIFQTILLEFLAGVLFFILPLLGYLKKVRLSYLFFALIGFLLPTIQGSFSSTPRYVIVLFPSFLILSLLLLESGKFLRVSFFTSSLVLLIIETALFLRGYWVA